MFFVSDLCDGSTIRRYLFVKKKALSLSSTVIEKECTVHHEQSTIAQEFKKHYLSISISNLTINESNLFVLPSSIVAFTAVENHN